MERPSAALAVALAILGMMTPSILSTSFAGGEAVVAVDGFDGGLTFGSEAASVVEGEEEGGVGLQ